MLRTLEITALDEVEEIFIITKSLSPENIGKPLGKFLAQFLAQAQFLYFLKKSLHVSHSQKLL